MYPQGTQSTGARAARMRTRKHETQPMLHTLSVNRTRWSALLTAMGQEASGLCSPEGKGYRGAEGAITRAGSWMPIGGYCFYPSLGRVRELVLAAKS
eukprot:1186953-Prorocentrum_minimum.AAC.3